VAIINKLFHPNSYKRVNKGRKSGEERRQRREDRGERTEERGQRREDRGERREEILHSQHLRMSL
jgi:hypothetical protein